MTTTRKTAISAGTTKAKAGDDAVIEPDGVVEPPTDTSSAKIAAEATGAPAPMVTLTAGGETFTVPADVMDNIELLEDLEDGQFMAALRTILGRDEWARMKEALRDDDGIVRTAGVSAVMEQLMALVDPIDAS